MRYRVMPFIGKIEGKQAAVEVSNQLGFPIDQGAPGGWRFEHIHDVNIGIQPGCLRPRLAMFASTGLCSSGTPDPRAAGRPAELRDR